MGGAFVAAPSFMERTRPAGVVAVAVLMVLSGLGPLVTSLVLLRRGSVAAAEIAVNVAFAAAMIYVAHGLWKLRPGAWVAALIIQALNGLLAVVAVATVPRAIGPWIALALAAAIVLYLTRPQVRAAFRRLP